MDTYNITWNSPSKDHHGSMPLGNGSTGLNVWIESDGSLVFYISRTDSWDDNGRLLKVGRVRISLNPAPATDDFLQTLSLADGTLKARCGETEIRLWVDANHPVIHAEFDGPQETEAIAAIELWRTERHTLSSLECSDMNTDNPADSTTIVEPDTVLRNQSARVGWYHHNRKSVGPAMHAKLQGVDGFKRQDPLLHRTFGAIIKAEGAQIIDDTHLLSPQGKRHRYDIYVHTEHPCTEAEWLAAVEATIAETEAGGFKKRRAAHEAWWEAFWQRSWIHATSGSGDTDDAFVVSRAYALQRYVNACGGRGAYPIKFNGSIFTVAHEGHKGRPTPGDADYRRWGSGYWWQNTRLPYVSMCTSGDIEMTEPLYQMYCRDLFEYHKYRTKAHTGHEGLFVPECISFWGDIFPSVYGWKPYAEREDKLQESAWHKWEWVSGLELSFMMLDRYDHTRDEAFLKGTLIPFAHEVLRFFDLQYETGADGKLVMHPAMACETWWECTNPMPEVAGLHAVTDRLLALPVELTDPKMRKYWSEVKATIPDLPTREVEGRQMFAPAEKFAICHNSEIPELYAVFPFRLCAFEKANVELGREAYRQPGPRGNNGWRQEDIFLAYLGLAEEARAGIVDRARNYDDESRFPAFWGPNMDWIPDQDHGGVLLKALQSMILQADPYSRKVYVAPAWPVDWDCEFKLHAPYQTIVEGRVANGKVVDLKVTPESRRNDVEVIQGAVYPSR